MRKRVPTSEAIAAGDPRKIGKRKLQERLEAEPHPERGIPECPRYITGLAREVWHSIKADLEAMDLDFRPDALMMAGVCRTYATAVEEDTPQAWTAFRLIAGEFPLSPVARTRLATVRAKDAGEDLATLLSKPREKRAEKLVESVQ
jgi:phage terminase small subunit